MARLTHLDLECLEYQEGFLSGIMLTVRGQPEQLNRVAARYASVLALLGRISEHEYYDRISSAAAPFIGRAARKAWNGRPLRHRIVGRRGQRTRWEQAYTTSLFLEAEDRLRNIRDETAAFRVMIGPHFTKAGARR
ncbi:MAG TPA: hypothetical protein VF867_11900 [Arthrobacter sp.]